MDNISPTDTSYRKLKQLVGGDLRCVEGARGQSDNLLKDLSKRVFVFFTFKFVLFFFLTKEAEMFITAHAL